MSRLPNLQNLPRQRLITPQHRPAGSIRLYQSQLELRAQNLERRLLCINGSVEWELCGISLRRRVACCKVQVHRLGLKLYLCQFFCDFL